MAPHRTIEEQKDEFRKTLENFTIGLHDAIQHAMENALTTVLQQQQQRPRHQQAPAEVVNDSGDEELHENLFAVHVDQHPPSRQARGQLVIDPNIVNRQKSYFLLEIPEFSGTLNTKEFIDWLNTVEEILEFKRVPDEMRVSLVATIQGRQKTFW